MEEDLCEIRIVKEDNDFVIHMHDQYGGNRELVRSKNIEEALDELLQDLQEQFEDF